MTLSLVQEVFVKLLEQTLKKMAAINSDPVGTNTDGSSTVVKDGSIEVGGKTYVVRELASQEMKNSAGATWDAATAGNAIGTWSSSFGDQIDVVASNNDGMGMSMFNAWSKDNQGSYIRIRCKQRRSCSYRRRLRRNNQPACRRTGLSDTSCSS